MECPGRASCHQRYQKSCAADRLSFRPHRVRRRQARDPFPAGPSWPWEAQEWRGPDAVPLSAPGGGASSDLVLPPPKMRESHEGGGVCVSMRPPCNSQNSVGSVPARKTSLRVVGQAGVANCIVVGINVHEADAGRGGKILQFAIGRQGRGALHEFSPDRAPRRPRRKAPIRDSRRSRPKRRREDSKCSRRTSRRGRFRSSLPPVP